MGTSNNLLIKTNSLQVTNSRQATNMLLTANNLGGTYDWS